MPREPETTNVPTKWFSDTITLLNQMAQDGILLEGYRAPSDLIVEVCDFLFLEETDQRLRDTFNRVISDDW